MPKGPKEQEGGGPAPKLYHSEAEAVQAKAEVDKRLAESNSKTAKP